SCSSQSDVRDFVGYGTANDFETNAAPTLSNTTSAQRRLDGTDTDNNAADFTTGAPTPQYSSSAPPEPCPSMFDFDFSGTEYTDCFRDVQRGGDIDDNVDVSGTNHRALNFRGSTGSAGATWLTVYDATPDDTTPGPIFGREVLCADVIFARFNNLKGAGLVALLNEGVGQRGLALIVSDAGNTDLLRLAMVEGDPTKQGKLTFLKTVPLRGGIAENVWYRLVLALDFRTTPPTVTGNVFTHTDPRDPNSPLGAPVMPGLGPALTYDQGLPPGVTSPGENAILAQAVSAVVDLSVTNFANGPEVCQPPQK